MSTAPRRRPTGPPPLLSEQIIAGALTAVVVALIEGARVSGSERAASLSSGPIVLAALHTIAFYLPAGLILGAIAAALIALLRTSPSLAPLRGRFASLELLFTPSPAPTASLIGALCGIAIVAFGARAAYVELVTTTHRADLAGWTMAGIALGLIALAFLAGTLARAIVLRIAPLFGPLLSIGSITVALMIAAWLFGARWMRAHPEVTEVYGAALLLPPITLFSYACSFGAARLALSRRGKRAVMIAAAATVLAALAIWATSGRTYGGQNRVRALVEEETIGGRWLLRRYTRITDLDGDRFSWGFGGRDCDDLDRRVHPGALDEPGDGVDMDCFAGDGAPIVERAGDGAYGARPTQLPEHPNVIIVTIDALRPDHLGSEGYPREITPTIDAFANESVRFDEVLAPSSRSIRSIPAMFTGLYPSQIAYGAEFLYPSLLPENTTLAEAMQARGYATAVTMGTDYFHRVRGFFQGFQDVEEIMEYKPARNRATDLAIQQLSRVRQRGGPFLQWIHLFHVHAPYLNPSYPSRFGPRPIDAYDTEVSLVDAELARILEAIRTNGLERSTIVVLASDHGEAFGEHGRSGHANTLFEEELQSVLMFRVPGVRPRRVRATASLIDVTPTLLNLADIPMPEQTQARSLVPLMTGERRPDRDRWFFAELVPDGMFPFDIKAIRHGRYKLHWWVQDGTIQLFDLARDPGERRDVSDDRSDHAMELLGTLSAWSARTSRAENSNEAFIAQHRMSAPPARMTHRLGMSYPGLFTVLGCDVPRTTVAPGETLDVTCYYRVDGETDRDLHIMLDLTPPPGYRAIPHLHGRHVPLHGRYPTMEWRSGEILRDPSPIRFPPEMAVPVELRLQLSVIDRDTRAVLPYDRAGHRETRAFVTAITVRDPHADAAVHRADGGPRP